MQEISIFGATSQKKIHLPRYGRLHVNPAMSEGKLSGLGFTANICKHHGVEVVLLCICYFHQFLVFSIPVGPS